MGPSFIIVVIAEELRNHDKYLAMFKGHVESYRHIRVVFTGRDGAGKTTVCCRLQNEPFDLKSRIPTVGAVLHPHWFSVNWKFKTWEHKTYQSPSEVIQTRMGTVMRNMPGSRYRSAQMSAYAYTKRFELEVSAVAKASHRVGADAAFLSLWDMGGHTSFQASHNIFISSHGVYLLVFRLTHFLKDKLETDRLKKWIRLIGTYSSVALNVSMVRTYAPPVIFVGTFLDELKHSTPDYVKQVDAIRLSISKFPEVSHHEFAKFCTLDNSLGNDDAALEILRGLITELAVHQDQWDRKVPTTWLKFEMDLLKAREEGRRILKLAEVVEMNKTSIAPLPNVDEIKLALEFLHCTRSVIYFREFDDVINDPQWLADFFSILITDDQFLPKNDLKTLPDLEMYTTKGELTPKLIDGLLSLKKNAAFLPHKSVLLALMEKFGLIVKLRMSETTAKNAQFSINYQIPSKLTELQEQDIKDITAEVGNLRQRNLVSNTLCIVFNNEYVPDELFHRIFAHVLSKYTAVSISTQSVGKAAEIGQPTTSNAVCLYRSFGCFKVDGRCRMILSMHAERSTIAVTVISSTKSTLPAKSGKCIRLAIEQILQDTLQLSNQQHLQYTHQLHCRFHLKPYDTPVHLSDNIHSEMGEPCKGEECLEEHTLSKADTAFWGITEDSARVQGKEHVADAHATEDMIHTEIKKIHADMVVDLAKYVYPGARYWDDFTTLVGAYLDPAECEGKLHNIVANLLMKKQIEYGQYDKLYDVVHGLDVTASPIIKEAESKIKTKRQEGTLSVGYEQDRDKTECDTSILNRRPTPRQLGRLSRLVNASRCGLLFVELGLPYPEIHTGCESRGLAGITQITKMFLKWTQTYPNHTFHHIKLAMTEVGMTFDCILKEVQADEEPICQDEVPNEVWNGVPSNTDIEEIVDNIGTPYFNLFLELGLSPSTIEQHERRHHVDIQERISALLNCWRNIFQRKATTGRLLTAMQVCQMDWHTTAQIWSICQEDKVT